MTELGLQGMGDGGGEPTPGGGSSSSGGTMRDGVFRDCGALVQAW